MVWNVRNFGAAELRRLLDYEAETGKFIWRRRPGNDRLTNSWNARYAGQEAGYTDGLGYIVIKLQRANYRAAHLAWLWVTGDWPDRLIDHINGCPSDNRIANLRLATVAENARNQCGWAKSGLKGAYQIKRGGRWFATIMVAGKRMDLGRFDTAEEAHAAYQAAAMQAHGAFARLT